MLNGKRNHCFFVSICLAILLTFSIWHLTTNVAQAETATPDLEGGTVTGSVYGADSIPLNLATVQVSGTGLRAVTNAEGTYTIPKVPAGGYTLTVIKPGNVNKTSDQIEVQEGGTATISLTLAVEQLLKNGGFEAVNNGIAMDWMPIQNGWSSYLDVTSEAARTGSNGLVISTNQGNNPWVMQPIPVEEGATYNLTSWFKAIGVTGNPGYKVEFYSGIDNTLENWVTGYNSKAPVSQNDGLWHELKYEIQAPLGSKYMYVFLRLYGTGTVYYDDASVVKTINPAQLLGLETDQIFYYPDVTNGKMLAKLRPEDGIYNNKTVDVRISLEGSQSAVFQQLGLPAAAEVNVPFDPTVMDLKLPYQITVELKDAWLQPIDQLKKTIYRWPRPTTLPENGPVSVEGQPFFPVIAYHANVEDYPYLKDIGINTVQGKNTTSTASMELLLDTAHANGLKVLAPLYWDMKVKENYELTRELVTALKDHPALLGWMIMDEPVLHGIAQSELVEAYKLIRSIDLDHPTYMVEYDHGAFRSVGQATDILTTDVYPYRTNFMQPISAVGSSVRRAMASVDDVKPIWTVLQTFRLQNSEYNYLPTITQVRNMAYQSFLAGSKGLAYYSINDPGWKLKDSELWPGLVSFKEELQLIGDLNAEGTKLQESIGSSVQWGVWEHGQERYAVAINLTKQEQSTSIPINLQGYQIEPMYGDQQMKWASWENGIPVTLAPEQTLVYRIESFTASVDAAMGELQSARNSISNLDWREKSDLLIGQLQQLQQALSSTNDTINESLEEANLSLQDLDLLIEWTEQQADSTLEGNKAELLDSLNRVRSSIEPIVQVVYNGGFEKQASGAVKADGWYMATNTWDRIVAHTGLASARLDPDPANNWNVLSTAYDRSIPVIAGKKYVLSGWVKNSSLNGLVQLGIRQVDAAMGTVGSYTWGKANNNSGWTRYEVSFTALPQTKTFQVYFKADPSVDGQAWIDDVQIQKDLNLFLNPGFEQLNAGKATNWSYYSTAGTSIATTSESARSGNYGIALKSVTTAMNPVLVKQGMVVVPGKTYEVSAWIRANNLQALGFKMYADDYNGTTYLSSQAGNYVKPGPGIWTKVTFRFTAPQGANNAVVNFRLYGIGNVNGTDQIDLDDIAVIEVDN
ncbi:carbohydrate binding domain-containing protein [Paenibacillus plantarum]|nr:carbohydrate binding domain-containing protein [Paenibacillus plantarum]